MEENKFLMMAETSDDGQGIKLSVNDDVSNADMAHLLASILQYGNKHEFNMDAVMLGIVMEMKASGNNDLMNHLLRKGSVFSEVIDKYFGGIDSFTED